MSSRVRARTRDGFRSLVGDTLREFGFEPDPELDRRPRRSRPPTYAAVWVALDDGDVVGSIALRDLGGERARAEAHVPAPRRSEAAGSARQLLETRARLGARERDATVVRARHERADGHRPAPLRGSTAFERVEGDAPRQGQRRLLYELRSVASAARRRARAPRRCRRARSRRRASARRTPTYARAASGSPSSSGVLPAGQRLVHRPAVVEVALVRREVLRLAAVAQLGTRRRPALRRSPRARRASSARAT